MFIQMIADSELLPVAEQVQMLESIANDVTDRDVEKVRSILKREYTRDQITTLEYLDLSRRVKGFSCAH